ncbi:hypothetical protein OOK41_23550 [Micromonospora sp. NBC_01655]|uniref:hypothetical protein n=1 Tax=Micromonospora sp. NBC_01655 TaxID=2975983 RepID=UPI00224F7890|nr:hypothetical protein [Micromonospora sp. NBC_01655]MCX4473245.1 hypothetical protein [Micromonospora sp. NBC_01655]
MLSDILMGGVRSLTDPFWDEMAQLLIAGLTADLMTGQPDRRNSLHELRSQLFDTDLRYRLAVALDTRGKHMPPSTRQEFEMLVVAFKSEWPTRMTRFNHLTDPVLHGWARPNPRHH